MEYFIFNARGTKIEVPIELAYKLPKLKTIIEERKKPLIDETTIFRICYGELYINIRPEGVHHFIDEVLFPDEDVSHIIKHPVYRLSEIVSPAPLHIVKSFKTESKNLESKN